MARLRRSPNAMLDKERLAEVPHFLSFSAPLSVILHIPIPTSTPPLLDSKDEYESIASFNSIATVQLTLWFTAFDNQLHNNTLVHNKLLTARKDASTMGDFTRFDTIECHFFGCLESSYINPIMSPIPSNRHFSPHGRQSTAPSFWACIEPPHFWSEESSPASSELHPLPAAKDQMRQELPLFTMFSLQPQLRLSRACQAPQEEVGQLQSHQRRAHAQAKPDGRAD